LKAGGFRRDEIASECDGRSTSRWHHVPPWLGAIPIVSVVIAMDVSTTHCSLPLLPSIVRARRTGQHVNPLHDTA
jgi:hypothetical protein